MNETLRAVATLYGQFSISAADLDSIAEHFSEEMEDGLSGRPSRLKMLTSHIGQPTGKEQGTFLALDFGGSNIRLLAVELNGERSYRVLRQTSWPLKNAEAGIDLTAQSVSAAELFDSIAAAIAQFAPEGDWMLGHTFSFPCEQKNINHAKLIRWTKEFRTSGVEGQDVTALLSAALARKGLQRIKPVAVINDTVGAYLAAAYAGEGVVAGAICGTGHNIAYLETDIAGRPVVINLESGNFDPGMGTIFDVSLDRASEKPGQQLMEKQVAGRYLGELFRLVLRSLNKAGILQSESDMLNTPYSIETETLSSLLADESSGLPRVNEICSMLGFETGLTERRAVKSAAALIVGRSARLTGAAFLGVLRRLDPAMTGRHTIAVDGSLYDKMPGYRETIERVLVRHLPLAAARSCLVRDGSGIGAAVAAGMLAKR